MFGRNTARWIYTLLLCTFTYYLIMQLGTSLCCHSNWFEEAPSPGTRQQTASRLICAKKSAESIPTVADDGSHQQSTFKMTESMFPRLPRRDVAANQLLRTRLTFSKSLMVSTAVSKLGCSGLVAATTMMNCCCNDCWQRSAASVFKSMRFCRLFPCVLCTFSCVFVINRNAFLWSVS